MKKKRERLAKISWNSVWWNARPPSPCRPCPEPEGSLPVGTAVHLRG